MPRSNDEIASPTLPPPDHEEESDELDDGAIGALIDALPELEPEDDEEPESNEFESNLELDLEAGSDELDLAVDVGNDADELLLPSEKREPDDDAEGLTGVEASSTSEDPALFDRSDDAEGFEEASLELSLLPALVRGDDAEGVNDQGELPASALFGDERPPSAAEHAFHEASPGLELEACGALASIEGIVVAASTDLFWFSGGEINPVRLEAGSSHIHAVTLIGTGWEFAICSTANGKLLRRGRLASASEELRRIRDAAELGVSRELFDLCQPGLGFPHALVLRTASGKLLRSDDDGISFRRVSDKRIVALAARGAPAVALSADGNLLKSDDGGGSFQEKPLTGAARRAASARAPMLCAHGNVIALADAELGILISRDGGGSFVRVPGTRGVSALCAGTEDGSACVFATLYDDAHDRTQIVRVRPEGPIVEAIAAIEGTPSDDDGLESARVARIVWDDVHARLWAAGSFGVKAFSRS